MAVRAARSRLLSRSGQPRRRLARRRQYLPEPVMHGRKVDDVLISEDPVIQDALLVTTSAAENLDSILTDATVELETESIVTV